MKRPSLLIGLMISGLTISCLLVPLAAAGLTDGLDETQYFAARNGLACSGCHGVAGGGGGEGGITIPAIAGVVGVGNRYPDASSFCRLLATGQTPSGIKISNLMPRYSLPRSDCTTLFRFAASLSTPLFASDDSGWSVQLRHDARSVGQSAWQSAITARLAQANQDGGLYGRTFAVNDANPAMIIIDLASNTAVQRSITPTILLQASGAQPLVKAIESGRTDEARAVIAAFPGEAIALIDPLKSGPRREILSAAAEATGSEIVEISACAAASRKPSHALILSLSREADFGLASLKACPSVQSVAISLRNVSSGAIAAATKNGLLPKRVSVFTPVPVGEQFTDIPKTISAIILDMARRMGANPTRAVQLEAFELAWKMHARGDGALFAGASMTEVDPASLSALSEPVWYDAP